MPRQLVSTFCLTWALFLAACLSDCSASPNSAGDRSGSLAPAGAGAVAPDEGAEPPALDPASPPDDELLTAELSTVGFDQLSGSPVVLLRDLDSGQVLPIWIGMAEARAISFELHGVELERPMTHDLLTHVLAALDARLEEVVVHDLREGTYYGLLKLRVDGEEQPRWVDTRPSDGLALALRAGATIRVAKKLFEDQPDIQFMAPEGDQVVRALGLTVVAPSAELRAELSLPERDGLVVIAVTGEAGRHGLARGDLIVALDGAPPREPLDLLRAIEDAEGGALEVTYWRDGGETTVELPVEAAPARRGSGHIA